MSRDFARKSSRRGGASPRQDEEPAVTPRRELPPWSWLIFGVILGFGLSEWLDEDPVPPAPRVAAVPAAAPDAGTDPRSTPYPPGDTAAADPVTADTDADSGVGAGSADAEEQKRFNFYTMLPEQKVATTPVKEYQPTPRDAENLPEYVLQVGSFRSLADAQRFAAGLKNEGFEPQISSTETDTGSWHRVRLGPYKDRRQMNKDQDAMARNNIQSLLIRLP